MRVDESLEVLRLQDRRERAFLERFSVACRHEHQPVPVRQHLRQRPCRPGHRFGAQVLREHDRLRLRSEEHTSELQSLMRISYAVFCLKKKNIHTTQSKIN